MECNCPKGDHECRLVVVTGGPGAGKTAVLEAVRRNFCEHVAVLPEAASILFGGGFPRRDTLAARKAAQRAIWRVQTELEQMVIEERKVAVALCDRGTLDGLAYWPQTVEELLSSLGATASAQLQKYAAVIHLRTPGVERGYNHQNPLRTESAAEAAAVDSRIALAWCDHPRRYFVDNSDSFIDKLARAVALIRLEVPPCCRTHAIDVLQEGTPPAGTGTEPCCGHAAP